MGGGPSRFDATSFNSTLSSARAATTAITTAITTSITAATISSSAVNATTIHGAESYYEYYVCPRLKHR